MRWLEAVEENLHVTKAAAATVQAAAFDTAAATTSVQQHTQTQKNTMTGIERDLVNGSRHSPLTSALFDSQSEQQFLP